MREYTEKGTPLPKPGELWELHYPGFPIFHLRIERIGGDAAFGFVEWAEQYPPPYIPPQPIMLSSWDAWQPRRLEEAS